MMKRYSFVILDDENQYTQFGGWKRVFDLFLIPKNYVKNKSADITLSEDSTFIKNSDPIEVQFFKPENNNYSTIYEKISKEDFQAKKDIYFIDMNWNNADSIKKTNIVEKNLEEISFEDINKGIIPSVLAGLNILNILPKNDKPKIVFSGSDKTENIRKIFKLLSNRVLTDDILIGEMTGGGNNNYIDEVERKVDFYLQSQQLDIINRQTVDKIQELNKIVTAWNGSHDNMDLPLIPNNGTDTNSENCWSLRTFFPKQVNRIELGIKEEENKNSIFSILEGDFRTVVVKLTFWHNDITKLKQMLEVLDFETSDKSGQPIEYFNVKVNLNAATSDNMRNSLKKQPAGTLKNDLKVLLEKYADKRLNKTITVTINSLVDGTDIVSHYGIYWGQLFYIARVLLLNAINYQKATNYCISFDKTENNELKISFESPNNKYNNSDWLEQISSAVETQKTDIKFNVLNTEKLIDVLKIVCIKWKSAFQIICGNKINKYEFTDGEFKIETGSTITNNLFKQEIVCSFIDISKFNQKNW